MTENIAMYARYCYGELDRRTWRGFPSAYMRKRF